jgi:hypothetical protein
LIDRSAHWVENIFADAERKERERARTLVGHRGASAGRIGFLTANGTETREERRHFRHESSGDEERPLEMGMTRARKGTPKEDSKGNEATDVASGEEANDADGGRQDRRKGTKRRGDGRIRAGRDKSFVKLKSSEDLLGRRMHGIAGGLTGLGDDE